MRYQEAGVDIERAGNIVRGIAAFAGKTWDRRVLSHIGSFGGLFEAGSLGKQPVLVSSIDGVGTKAQVAKQAGRFAGLGLDLVHHSVNDILVQGAQPLFFLDYVAAARLDGDVVLSIVEGMAEACRRHNCALLGGETAEMPGTYTPGDYDLVGCIVGVAEREQLLTGETVEAGDQIWGLPSSGLHTNGFSLARKVLLEEAALDLERSQDELGSSLAEALLAPHRSYFHELWPLIESKRIHALSHITGGGLRDNIPRVLPPDCDAILQAGSWQIPRLFSWIAELGSVSDEEMRRVFNLGIGMVVILPGDQTDSLQRQVASAVHIGEVVAGEGSVRFVED